MGYARVSLYVEEWPAMDQRLWREATRLGDFLEIGGPAGRWSAKTLIQVAKDYGRFLCWMNDNGGIDEALTPTQRLNKPVLAGYLAHLQATGMGSVSLQSRFRNLHAALRVMEPHAEIPLFKGLLAKLKAQAVPRRSKHNRIVEPATLIDRSFEFYDSLVHSVRPMTVRRAHQARDALMLALLASHPIRLANFSALSLGHNLIPTETGYTLHLGEDETKEHRPYTTTVDDNLVPYLDHYIDVVRPFLLKEKSTDQLWVSIRGTGVSDSTVHYQLNKITKKLIGHSINPHLIRDCVMTSLANNRPEQVLAGARLLGHNSLKTSEKHYNQANGLVAHRQYVSALQALRERHRNAQADENASSPNRST